jgi:hypothetical protein
MRRARIACGFGVRLRPAARHPGRAVFPRSRIFAAILKISGAHRLPAGADLDRVLALHRAATTGAMTVYFAYGANMERDAMRRRCPGATALGIARLPAGAT